MRDHYGVATEEPQWAVTSTPHDAHYVRGCIT
jgi:hypothetical protein